MEEYDENNPIKKNTMAKQASESLFTYIYLDNSYHDNYGSIIQSLNYQKSLGNYQYPKILLSNNEFDINKHKKHNYKHQKANKNK